MMDCYRTHKTSRIMAVVLSLPLLIFVSLIVFMVIEDAPLAFLLLALPVLFVVRYLLAQNFVTVCLDEHTFFIKKALYKKEQHAYSDIHEIVLIALPQVRRLLTGVEGENRAGEVLGRTVIHISEHANQNSHHGKQIAIRFNDNTITTLNSNYIIDGNVLLEELSRKGEVSVKEITTSAFRDWKKRDFGTDL